MVSWRCNKVSQIVTVCCLFTNNEMIYVMIAFLPVHLESSPRGDQQMEEKLSEQLAEAGKIFAEMKSALNVLLENLREDSSDLYKDKVREILKREISTALEAGGIPPNMVQHLTKMFVGISMRDIHLVSAEPGE